jgi:hypothetical protein
MWPLTRALALMCFLSISAAAATKSTADVVSDWGLLGTWALDCGQSASRQNGYLSYVIKSGGRVSHERDFGDLRDANQVLGATIHSNGSLELTVHFKMTSPPQSRTFSFVKGSDGRIRAITNSRVDGTEQTIRDGRFTANGNTTPWQTRCH